VVITAANTLTVQKGTATVIIVPQTGTWLDSATIGTTVRLTKLGSPSTWMQGSITLYSGVVISIAVSMTSGSGTASAWQLTLAPTYPPSLTNMRSELIAGLGWVTDGQGTGAQLLPIIDPTSTAVIGAQILNPGSGYLYGPGITTVGAGHGAVIHANLTVVSASVKAGGTAWQVGDVILMDQPARSQAQLTVLSVDSQGSITNVSVTTGGEYHSFPVVPQTVTNGIGTPAELNISLGIGNVWVSQGGSNYIAGGTTLSTAGTELLPSWQTTWQPYLNMGTVFTEYGSKVVGNETSMVTSQIYYQRWPLQHVILELQGINWTGDTTWDHESTSFDGGATFWAEWLEPRDTIFDTDLTIFNQTNTRFDDDYTAWQAEAYYAWGSTLFDEWFTIFDLYGTTYDQGPVLTQSLTLLRRLIRVTTQEISGHNVIC
jgi:hypothetical protein